MGLGVGVEFNFEVVFAGIASTAPREPIVACGPDMDCTRGTAGSLAGNNRGIPSEYFVLGSAWRANSSSAIRMQIMRNKEARKGHLRGKGL